MAVETPAEPTPRMREVQEEITNGVAESLLLLDLHKGISEETRLGLAVDIAAVEGYEAGVRDAIAKLDRWNYPQCAEDLARELLRPGV
jgi:hypothetical protein